MVSHQLKTPLTAISSYIQLLLKNAKKEDVFNMQALTRIQTQAKKMTSMIEDFLNMGRLEDGKIHLSNETFDLYSLVEEIKGDAQMLTTSHTVTLKDCNEVSLYANRDKIGQVLFNLVTNAIKYSPMGGTITIGCKKLPGKVNIYVSDEGVGINKTDQKRLFERFYRVAKENVKGISGFGIGLYLVAEILRRYNSEIKVESKEGVGSTFHFNLAI